MCNSPHALYSADMPKYQADVDKGFLLISKYFCLHYFKVREKTLAKKPLHKKQILASMTQINFLPYSIELGELRGTSRNPLII